MQPRRRRRLVGRDTPLRWRVARFHFFRRWISDDIAQRIAGFIPVRSRRARRLVREMRRRVLLRMREEPIDRFTDVPTTHQEAVDDVTTEVMIALERGDPDLDPVLLQLRSP